jgi:uncharacterized membrane protein
MPLIWMLLAAGLNLAASPEGDEPAAAIRVVTPRDDGIVATGINGLGEVVGFHWVESEDRPGVVDQRPFFARGKEMTYLPLLAGYTSTFPAAVSDRGSVVGRAGKPAPPGVRLNMRNQAFIWDADGGIRGLGALPDDSASFACGVSRDGRRVSGISIGDGRIRACVWERDGEGWKATALPQLSRLGSQVVAISGDGKFVAAVDGASPCLWTQDDSGRWSREVIGEDGSLVPRGVNDSGTVVGLRFTGDGLVHAVVRPRSGVCKQLDEPDGFVKSEANAVNNDGVVVGMIDGPAGSKIGPNAFHFGPGRLRVIHEGGPAFTAATAINDHGQVAGVLEVEDEEVPAQPPPIRNPR